MRLRPNLNLLRSPRGEADDRGGSGGLDDGAGFEEAMAALFVDLELLEEAMADDAEGFVDGLGAGVGEGDGPAGPLVVAPGGPPPVDDDAEDFSGVGVEVGGPDGELEEV